MASGILKSVRLRLAQMIHPDAGAAHKEATLAVQQPVDALEQLVYARGFLLTRAGAPPAPVATWAAMPVGEYTLYVDPRVPVQKATKGRRSAWLVGDAFDPVDGIYQGMADHLIGGDLLQRLDQAAGRFVLFVQDGERLEVYHDAMGSRSVFHVDGDVVASHAALAAHVVGMPLREWILPFITSSNYTKRDVKYLPGLESPFEKVVQLTPNTRLVLPTGKVERYWPREPREAATPEQAVAALVRHLEGLRTYLQSNGLRPTLGVSAGRDSRAALAALKDLDPYVFTFVRSAKGQGENSKDSRTAKDLTSRCGLTLDIVKLTAPPPLDETATPFAAAFRRNTGYIRGSNARWVECLAERGDLADSVFVRGFGGEVMRVFYRQITEVTPKQLAAAYDVNAGSCYSRDAFERFIARAAWTQKALRGYSLDDIFYWEHRMGIWGASAMSEADMAFRSMPAYNTRSLFSIFMGLPSEARDTSELFEAATERLAPEIGGLPYDS